MELLFAALGILSVSLIFWGWGAKPKRGWFRIVLGALIFLGSFALAVAYGIVMMEYLREGGTL